MNIALYILFDLNALDALLDSIHRQVVIPGWYTPAALRLGYVDDERRDGAGIKKIFGMN